MHRRRVPERQYVEKEKTSEESVNHCVKEEDCIKNVIKRIIKAQDKAIDDCAVSCESSIQQLLRGHDETELKPAHTTIPFVLFCSHTCRPFIGSGIFQSPPDQADCTFFGCVESPVFRAKRFVDNSDHCVSLELLLPVTDDCDVPGAATDSHENICSFFPKNDPVTDFMATGICLTVDLNSFNAITCLNPITPIPSSEFPPLESAY